MRPPPTLVRRAVLDPLWLPAAAVFMALLALVTVIAAAAWPLTRRRRVLRVTLFAMLYLFADAGLVLGAAVLWVRWPVPARRDLERWNRTHARMLRWALSLLLAAAGPLFGFRVDLEEPPDADRLRDRALLVLARHGGPGDSFTLVELLLTRYRRQPRIVVKQALQWDPGLDLMLTRLRSCFIPSRSGAGEDLPARVADAARSLTGSDALLIFPEGGNWTPRRHRRAIARLRRSGHYGAAADAGRNPHVLPPRPAGVLACLDARPDLDVVVVAHTGLEDLVSPAQIWRAIPLVSRPMTVRWWHEPAAALPASAEDRLQWLQVQWTILDSWIGARKAQACQPPEDQEPQILPAENVIEPSADPDRAWRG
jgi:1-acyl-sn-glycerol-3-phosphate acyltransferase